MGFFEFLGHRSGGPVFVDSGQGVCRRFLIGGGPRVELLENLPGSHTLVLWLGKKVSVYAFCYLVPGFAAARDTAFAQGALVVRDSMRRIAFTDRLIFFAS
jgi:methylmalonyl-CoA/ethylmalonyl-CoA epimerase|tara:strand:+ start:140 stop:442 length:303 start_codon:yes stop_codon:yes gene_type:complete